ncbi:hypothetical protein Hdeb2414_s0059g00760211 [Helianthus debilis subsp. tardiflorus]
MIPGAIPENHILNKRSLFHQAFTLYYEKMKKFTEAKKMYHLVVQQFRKCLGV